MREFIKKFESVAFDSIDEAVRKSIILDFLKWPKEKQLECFKDAHLGDINVWFSKPTTHRRNQSLKYQRTAAQDPIHSDFEALMGIFNINKHTGEVWRWSEDKKSGKKYKVLTKLTKEGYLTITFRGRTYCAHRLVMMKHLGRFIGPGLEVNHIDLNHLNNRASNLEEMTSTKNKQAYHTIRKMALRLVE